MPLRPRPAAVALRPATRVAHAPPRRPRGALVIASVATFVAAFVASVPLGAQEVAPPALRAPAPAPRTLDAAVRVSAGTLGVGAEVAKLLTGHLAARVGVNVLGYSRTQAFDDVTYDGELRLRNASVLVDLYPARRGSFHVTGGVILGGGEVTGTGVPEGGFVVNGSSYDAAQVGTLRGALTFPRTRPYAGLGWGTPANTGTSVRMLLDLGVAFGKPTVTLQASNAAPGSALAADVAEQQASMQADADTYLKLYPVMRTGLSVRF